MKHTIHRASRRGLSAALILAGALAVTPAASLAAGKGSIEGAWKVTKVEVTGANPLTIAVPQSSLYIFAGGHYSTVADTSRTPRTAAAVFKDPANPTDAEKLAKYAEWSPFQAQAGSYEVKGTTLIRHPVVSKNLAALEPSATPEAQIKLVGDTLTITSKSPPGQPERVQTLTLTRVK